MYLRCLLGVVGEFCGTWLPFLCIATHFLLPLRYKGLERTINLRSLPTSLIGRHLHWSVLVFNAHLLSLSRIIVPTPNFNAPMPAGMPPGQRHKTCGIPAPTVPNASRLGVCMTLLPVLLVRRSSRTCSTPCRTFLADMQHDPSASSLASETWIKWNRTLVNRWEKEQRGPPLGSRSHPACTTCMTYGRWYEPNHRYLNIPFTCTWVFYDYFSSYSLMVILCSWSLQNFRLPIPILWTSN